MGRLSDAAFAIEVTVRVRPGACVGHGNPKRTKFGGLLKDGDDGVVHEEKALCARSKWSKGIICMAPLSNGHMGTPTEVGRYHAVLGPETDQPAAYDAVMPELMESFVDGFDVTLFTYGQTGSGKTHTLFGPPGCLTRTELATAGTAASARGATVTSGTTSSGSGAGGGAGAAAPATGSPPSGAAASASSSFPSSGARVPLSWGMLPRALLTILHFLESDPSAQLSATAVEVYLDNVHDLLNKKMRIPVAGMGKNAKSGASRIYGMLKTATYDAKGKWVAPYQQGKLTTETGYNPSGAKSMPIRTRNDVALLTRLVEATRVAQSHALNDRSSRSHCVVKLTLTRRSRGKVTTSRWNFVDLAGSERVKKSQSDGFRFAEAKNINTSLSALARCIAALTGKKGASKRRFIPYRDSTLTMLMKESLSGAVRTALVVCVSESPAQGDETRSSLMFGKRCGSVSTRPTRRTEDAAAALRQARANVEAAEAQLASMQAAGMAGGINMETPAPTRASFAKNQRGVADNLARAEAAQVAMAEMVASGRKGSKEYAEAAKTRKYCKYQAEMLQGIVSRMIFAGVWKPPHSSYSKKQAELRQLWATVRRLEGGNAAGAGAGARGAGASGSSRSKGRQSRHEDFPDIALAKHQSKWWLSMGADQA